MPKALTVVHGCHPATRLSSSTMLLHVVFGRPGLLLPYGLHSFMPHSIPSSASDLITWSVHVCGLLDLLVWDGQWPSYCQYAFVLESVWIICFCFCEFPSSTTIKTAVTIVLKNVTFVFVVNWLLITRQSKQSNNIDTYFIIKSLCKVQWKTSEILFFLIEKCKLSVISALSV